jgi:hypothetical protein
MILVEYILTPKVLIIYVALVISVYCVSNLDYANLARSSLAISLRGVGPARGRLGDVLNPHREVKPVKDMMSRTGAGGFAERSWTSAPSLRMVTGVAGVAPNP